MLSTNLKGDEWGDNTCSNPEKTGQFSENLYPEKDS